MDEIVKKAMLKWPNVPDCFGWLGLDGRGNWFVRDDRAQSIGEFSSAEPGARGSMLNHRKLIEYIQRNYSSDSSGQWYFQNGPQRVYVELAVTPWIWRVDENCRVTSHCGRSVQIQNAITDEKGWLYLETTLGFGLVHSQDMFFAANAVEAGDWTLGEPICSEDIESIYSYTRSPNKKAGTKTGLIIG